MPVKPLYLLVAGGGGVLVWSGLKGKQWSSVVRNMVAGKNPQAATTAYSITGTPAGDTTTTGGTSPVPIIGSSASEKAVMVAILAGIGAPPTTANINSMVAWSSKECPWNALGPDGAEFTHNPFNTTQSGFGATGNVNSIGVKIYPSWPQGIAATVAAMRNGLYSDIISALRSGQGLCGRSFRGLATWSDNGYSSVC